MRRSFFLGLGYAILVFATISCSPDYEPIFDGPWYVQSLTESGTSAVVTDSMRFEFNADNTVNYKKTLNNCSGDFAATNGGDFTFGAQSCTLICCDSFFTNRASSATSEVSNWALSDSDNTLTLSGTDTEIVLVKEGTGNISLAGDEVKLEKTPCFGSCPVYDITVKRDGRATYNGTNFVNTTGTQTTNLDQGLVNAMFASLDALDFQSFDPLYDANITDLPSSIVTYQGKTVTVRVGGPADLNAFIDQLHNLAVTTGFIN